MTKALAMMFFLLSVTMFSIGLYKYLMQFDAPTPAPYPPLEVNGFAELQRRFADDDDSDADLSTHCEDVHDADCCEF